VTVARRWKRRSRPSAPWLLAASIAAAAAGAGAAMLLGVGAREEPARPAPPPAEIVSGVARLPLPDGWEPLKRPPAVAGFGRAAGARALYSEVALDTRRPEDASLLPAAVAANAGEMPAPRARRFGERRVWDRELAGGPDESRLAVFTLPTTKGVVTVACQTDAGTMTLARIDCETAMQGVQLTGAAPLRPVPETATRMALPAAVARLNERRRQERRALAAARTPGPRAAAARSLAAAYAEAAAALRPLAAGAAKPLPSVLDGLAGAHRRLASASARRAARAAGRAGVAIGRGERRLAALLKSLTPSAEAAR